MNAFATFEEAAGRSRTEPRAKSVRRVVPMFAVLAMAVIGIVIQCMWLPIDSDVSWLITVCERILGGERLYVDIIEVNPPASVWLYLPLVWLAHAISVKPEAVVAAAFVSGSVVSIAATLKLTSRLDRAPPALWLAPVLAFVTLVLPMGLFAQREHAALLLALPAFATLALIAEGKPVSKAALFASGFAAGLIVVIKPPFLLAVAAPALWAAWKRKSLRPIALPIGAGIAATLIYAVAVVFLAPAYFRLLSVIGQTYAPMHEVLWKVVVGPALYPAVCFGLAALLRPPRIPPLAIALGLGSAGFVLAAILQAKNYPNHLLPGTGLAIAALIVVMAEAGVATVRRVAVSVALTTIVAGAMYQWFIRPQPVVEAAVRKVAPPKPTVIALSPQLRTGHPLTRNIGGRWVGSSAGLFTAAGALFVGLQDEGARKAYRADIDSFVMDVARNRPDIVLVDRDSKSWLMREPAIARTMRAYRPAGGALDTEVWVRRSASAQR